MDAPEAECLINLLPPELLYRIFTSIDDPKALCRAERTCHRWRSIIDSQALWRNLATKISSARILPEKFNELGKGSLINGRYVVDGDGGRWNYMYRDLVRNIHCLNRIPNVAYNASDAGVGNNMAKPGHKPEITQVLSSMSELSELPKDYTGSKDSYVTRKIDFTSSATEGMRLQPRPIQICKTPAFTDSLCPGETSFEEAAWVYFADQLAVWPRPHNDIIFDTPPIHMSQTTLQKGVIRTGTNGVFGEGPWAWPGPKKDEKTDDKPTNQLIENEKGAQSPSDKKRPWKDDESASGTSVTRATIAEELVLLATTEVALPPEKKTSPPDPAYPSGSLKWAAPVDSSNTLPHARRWDKNQTLFGSYRNYFNLTPQKNPECLQPAAVESAINSLYGEMCNQAHSDPNLRINYQRLSSSFPDMIAAKVDRLALPPSELIKKDPRHPMEPIVAVNASWNLFGEAKWSLNSVPFLGEIEALEIDHRSDTTNTASEPWWVHETRYQAGEDEPPSIWENAHKWEYRSCGDYLIISDDIGMSGPCTISCFKVGYHKEKTTVDPRTYLRGAALRNYLAAGPTSDLIWQKCLKSGGYIYDAATLSPVQSLEHPNFPRGRPSYFLDNDGLSLNSKVVVYATRKKVFITLDHNNVIIFGGSGQSLSCMEFHVIAIETGHTINILDLDHEVRSLDIREASWYGWACLVMTDTHLMATVGGHVHDTEGAEQQDDSVARTWTHNSRYSREEIFIWPLDLPNQNLSLPPEQRMIRPTGRLAVGFNEYRWWHRDRYLSLSRDGRFLAASSKYTLVVWDLWLGDQNGVVYYFDQHSNGLQGYNISKVGDVPWNGMWVQYRDIIVDPNHKTFTNSNPNHEQELLRKLIFIPNNEIRLFLQGTNLEYEKTEEGKIVAQQLQDKLSRRYSAATDSDSDSTDSWETDDNGDEDYQDDSDDDYDSDGGGFRSNRFADDDDWDDEADYDPDYGSGGDDDEDDEDDDDSGDSIQGFTVQRVSEPSESREQPSSVKKRKLETTESGAGESSAAGGSSQDPVPVIGWGDAADGNGKEDGWATDDGGGVDESW
ncbi:hypothetical protein TWF481_003197 [Arthrobotrys musiformis]|uniref:F-box domain-containing protein n=1 Tax=Arthrobotrys musiformis TaxID=47236 RepID=A0AAV9VRN7_9PEZI